MPAQNNRTLTLTEADREQLLPQLLTLDAWRSSDHDITDRVICADLFETIESVPDGCASLIVIDPPYNLTKRYGTQTFAARTQTRYEEWLMKWLPAVCRKLSPTGSLYICGDWRSTASLQRALIDAGLTILNRITWQREKGRGAVNNWKNGMEDIWFAVRNPEQYYFDVDAVMMKRRVKAPYIDADGQPKDWEETAEGRFRLTCPSNFWDDLSVPFWSMPENTCHPTQKPEKLLAKLILASSRPGDLVFDPFLGSGTTAVTAYKLGRHYCGIEMCEDYCLLALKRLALAQADKTIQGYQDGVFWERNSVRYNR